MECVCVCVCTYETMDVKVKSCLKIELFEKLISDEISNSLNV